MARQRDGAGDRKARSGSAAGAGREDTREAILDVAKELLQNRSFNAFSYQDIADRVGIRKASIHYHFAGKEELGVALVDRFRREGRAWARELAARGASPQEKLEALFAYYRETVVLRGDKICAYGILSAEYNALPDDMRVGIRAFHSAHIRWLTDVLTAGREAGVFQAEDTAEDQALLVASALQGAVQIARTAGDPGRYEATVQQLRRLLLRPELGSKPSP
ncbi:MAG TPA: TetR/AcrR family transcriptional regulator [Thermoanaerobaculia bacterium]|jgi:TetR/AcrR family transcriptional repressor of nem operon|nr:TetR/AcrR family transcriptional regulator [Thermoanaerobaculia bacterium]